MELTIDGRPCERRAGQHPAAGGALRRHRHPHALPGRPAGAVRGLPSVPCGGGGRQRTSAGVCHQGDDGMVVRTDTDEIFEQRKVLLDLLLRTTVPDCLVCDRSGALPVAGAWPTGSAWTPPLRRRARGYPARDDTPFIAYDPSKCILCGRCVGICDEVQMCHVLASRSAAFRRNLHLVRPLHGRDGLRDVRQLRLLLPHRRTAGQAQPGQAGTGTSRGRHRLSVLRLRLQHRAARERRQGRAGRGTGRPGARRGQPLRQGPLRLPVHQPRRTG